MADSRTKCTCYLLQLASATLTAKGEKSTLIASASVPQCAGLHVEIPNTKRRWWCVAVVFALVVLLMGTVAFLGVQARRSEPDQTGFAQGIAQGTDGATLEPEPDPEPEPEPVPAPLPGTSVPPSSPPLPDSSTDRPTEGAGACCSNCFPYRHACDVCMAGCTSKSALES